MVSKALLRNVFYKMVLLYFIYFTYLLKRRTNLLNFRERQYLEHIDSGWLSLYYTYISLKFEKRYFT